MRKSWNDDPASRHLRHLRCIASLDTDLCCRWDSHKVLKKESFMINNVFQWGWVSLKLLRHESPWFTRGWILFCAVPYYLLSFRFALQIDSDPEHTLKAAHEFIKPKILQWTCRDGGPRIKRLSFLHHSPIITINVEVALLKKWLSPLMSVCLFSQEQDSSP